MTVGINISATSNTLICPAHALFTPGKPVNTPCLWPCLDMFSLSNCLPHSLLKHTPFYGGILQKDVCKPAFIWSYCWHFPSTIVYPIPRH